MGNVRWIKYMGAFLFLSSALLSSAYILDISTACASILLWHFIEKQDSDSSKAPSDAPVETATVITLLLGIFFPLFPKTKVNWLQKWMKLCLRRAEQIIANNRSKVQVPQVMGMLVFEGFNGLPPKFCSSCNNLMDQSFWLIGECILQFPCLLDSIVKVTNKGVFFHGTIMLWLNDQSIPARIAPPQGTAPSKWHGQRWNLSPAKWPQTGLTFFLIHGQ